MGWFKEQIEERKRLDEASIQDAYQDIYGSLIGKKISKSLGTDKAHIETVISQILSYYHLKITDVPDSIKKAEDIMEYCLRPRGVMHRVVKLTKGWYRDSFLPLIATLKTGEIVALIPSGLSSYSFYDPATGKKQKVHKKQENLFEDEALCFYRPLPDKPMNEKEFLKFLFKLIRPRDYFFYILASLLVVVLGLITPRLTNLLFGAVYESADLKMLVSLAVYFCGVTISVALIKVIKNFLVLGIQNEASSGTSAATMMRLLSLPTSFFKDYSAGSLATCEAYLESFASNFISFVLQFGLSTLFSLLYLTQIYAYGPALLWPSIVIVFVQLALSLVSALVAYRANMKRVQYTAEESGLTYASFTGIEKIKLAGAEKRVFSRWGHLTAKKNGATYNPPLLAKIGDALSLLCSLGGAIWIYYVAYQSGMSTAAYYAFNTAYGQMSGAFLLMSNLAALLSLLQPMYHLAEPILKAQPEFSDAKSVITRLSGNVELSEVSFKYDKDGSNILDNLSIKIHSGDYVAIVGKTGCGKSTLMRLLLGFETPDKGAIYFDGRDLSGIDLNSLRTKIGVVMQDGKLFHGDIYSNIVISAPQLTLKEAWEAAKIAGIDEDIKAMPMGMNTLIAEGGGGISGGQKQRLLIARAIANKPRLLMLDEATSALDNTTQKNVADSLARLKCTRIVIAHRLSTIKNCNRILYLENGKIQEDGTYDELMAKNGLFAKLVERQQVKEEP